MARFANAKAPFVRVSDESISDTKGVMRDFFIALLPIILFSWIKNGILVYLAGDSSFFEMLYPLFMICLGGFLSVFFEFIFFYVTSDKEQRNFASIKKKLNTSYAAFPGIILVLILPLYTPVWVLIFGVFMATLVGKMLFGGFGYNIFNPALIGYMAVMFTLAGVIKASGGSLNPSEVLVDAYAGATPLGILQETKLISYQTLVAPYGNLFDFFLGTIPGSLGETSALAILISYCWLVYRKVIRWYSPLIFIATVFGLSWIIGVMSGESGLWFPTYSILSGGLMYGAVFMSTEPVTTPRNPLGKIFNALFLGVLTVLFRFIGMYPEGVATSIVVMNIFTMPLDKTTAVLRASGVTKKTWPKLAILVGLLVLLIVFALVKANAVYSAMIGGLL